MNLLLLVNIIFYISSCIGLYGIFKKSSINPSLAFVPVLNYLKWLKLLEKPWWWIFIFIFPGVNFLMFSVLVYCTSIYFNRRSMADVAMACFLPFIAIIRLGFDANSTLVGYPTTKEKNIVKEWVDALVFAVIAASIIRGYFLEAFTIPTSSMEKDMLIGDYLFVSKLHYGVKIPQTPVAFPFVHNNMPFSYVPSYLKSLDIPYTRMPKFTDIQRHDRVVFNFPTGDTAILGFTPQTSELQGHNYYQMVRDQAFNLYQIEHQKIPGNTSPLDDSLYMNQVVEYEQKARKLLLEDHNYTYVDYNRGNFGMINTSGFALRPIDRKENYIKRCVALPGDVLELKDGILHINGAVNEIEHTQHNYLIQFNRNIYKKERLDFKKRFDINTADLNQISENAAYIVNMSDDVFQEMELFFSANNNTKNKGLNIISAQKMNYTKEQKINPRREIYPNHPSFNWTVDNFGPLWMPKAGESIELNDSTYTLYKRCIQDYEHNKIEKRNDGFYINDQKTEAYTFKQGYYFLIGDNRHNSADSRFWGFVPHDHIVGKAVFRWLSLDPELGWFDGKIRWNRLFRIVHD